MTASVLIILKTTLAIAELVSMQEDLGMTPVLGQSRATDGLARFRQGGIDLVFWTLMLDAGP